MPKFNNEILITDSSVLINFLNINRIDLLDMFPCDLLITEHVVDEITSAFPDQIARLNDAISMSILTIVSVASEDELDIYNLLIKEGRLGSGECSAIACAIVRKYTLAIDDIRAIKQASKQDTQLVIINTQDIIVRLIREDKLSINDADAIKDEWQNKYRFALKIKSFADLLP